jgi:hypothetical protein
MIVTRLRASAGAVIVALLVGCGAEGTESEAGLASTTDMNANLTEALEEVRSNVDALLDGIAPGAPKKPRSDNSKEQSCNDAEGAPTGQFRSQFGYIVDTGSLQTADLLGDIQEFFESKGLAVNASRIPDDPPAVFAEGSGFSYSAILNSVGELVVGGSTPCFPPE